MISELKKVRGLPWHGVAETLKAAIVTQQDQDPSGRPRAYLTTKVVARHGATPGCSGCGGLGLHADACRVRLEKALADERASADPVGAGVGPIAEPATEPQQPAPAAQQEQRLHHRVLLCRCRHKALRTSSQIRQWMGAQERRERKGAWPSETSPSEISESTVGGIVLSAAASSRKDEMMIGGLYVIVGIDVVATLVPEEEAWHVRGH